ncbi:hypothetical protein BDY19DRAFT_992325 [Irpex rosettiformis]|uniref:Uncharacterized protein n=1 Tax=Irpex rosettiformis TaxID=378272 RepID=A0ACB8U7Z7_9APHY|nr:hypothetical protein BDY19DRAFT_992325 [Irpex rosettiformis]
MKLSTAFLTVVAAVALPVLAVPSPVAEPAVGDALDVVSRDANELEKRDNSIYVCTGQGFTGQCTNYFPTYNVCTPWSALGLSGLGSWGPAQGVYCIWYNKPCGSSDTTGSDSFTYPGFSSVPGYWQFNTQSWKCWW